MCVLMYVCTYMNTFEYVCLYNYVRIYVKLCALSICKSMNVCIDAFVRERVGVHVDI